MAKRDPHARRTAERTARALVAGWAEVRDELGIPFAGARGECILATRLGVGAMEALGVDARPLPVSFAVANPIMTELLAAGMGFDEARVLPGAGGRGSPGGGTGEEWEGHLVVYVPKARLIADLTLDQAIDLGRDVFVIPRVTQVPPHFWSGEPVADRVGYCSVFYRHTPTDQGWRQSENWAGHRQVARGMVAVLAGAVREKLREQRAAVGVS